MLTKVLALTMFLWLAAWTSGGTKSQPEGVRLPAGPEANPLQTPAAWPDLDTLQKPTCSIDGAVKPGTPEAGRNRLLNRYHLPDKPFEKVPLEYLQLNLPQGDITPEGRLANIPTWEDQNNRRAVTIVGYVTDVRILGCGGAASTILSTVNAPKSKGVESANCYTNEVDLCTAQIMVTPDRSLPRKKGQNLYAVKVTRRSRWLARHGFLTSNIGNDWSTTILRDKLKRRWVRFSGWLFFSENFSDRAWASDPADKIGKRNMRQTAWGIHPVMGIEVVPPPPGPRGLTVSRNRRKKPSRPNQVH